MYVSVLNNPVNDYDFIGLLGSEVMGGLPGIAVGVGKDIAVDFLLDMVKKDADRGSVCSKIARELRSDPNLPKRICSGTNIEIATAPQYDHEAFTKKLLKSIASNAMSKAAGKIWSSLFGGSDSVAKSAFEKGVGGGVKQGIRNLEGLLNDAQNTEVVMIADVQCLKGKLDIYLHYLVDVVYPSGGGYTIGHTRQKDSFTCPQGISGALIGSVTRPIFERACCDCSSE